MRPDYLSFKRAASYSLLGLGLQLVLALALLIHSSLSADAAALTASLYAFSGLIVWLILAVVYDQHRRERIEAMEAESLTAATARQSTVFEESAEDLRVAAKRVGWMHKILVPGASLALAALLIGLGLWRFADARPRLDDKFVAPVYWQWAIAVGLAAAVTGFLFARWISGMAKQPVWANLRAGATQVVGVALMGVAILVGELVQYGGHDTVLRYLNVAFSAAMVALGAEIVLNFILTVYRPRRPGEIPRPAFDSRVLGFVAAPDRIAESLGEAINYQFGFEVTSNWFYQLLSRSLVTLILVGAALVWAMSFVAVVGPDERGLRIRNGDMVGEVGPGPYLKYPWPFERVETYKATQARRLDLASPAPAADKPILWTNEHVTNEAAFYVLVRAPGTTIDGTEADAAAIRDLALVSVEVPVYYSVESLEKFERLGPPKDRETILRAVGQRELVRYMATVPLDDILGRRRADASAEIRHIMEKRYAELDCGIRLLFVGIEGIHPPTDTAATFEQVVASQQMKQTNITMAQSERVRTLSEAAGSLVIAEQFLAGKKELEALQQSLKALPGAAGSPDRADLARKVAEKEQSLERLLASGSGSASVMLRQAKAARWTKHMDQRRRAEAFKSQLVAFRASPSLYAAQHYFQTMHEILAGCRLYIVGDDPGLEVRTDLTDIDNGGNPLSAPVNPD